MSLSITSESAPEIESEQKSRTKPAKIRKNKTKEKSESKAESQAESSPEQIKIVSRDAIQNFSSPAFFRALCEKNLKYMIQQYSRLVEKQLKIPQAKTLEIWNELAAKSGLEIDMNLIISIESAQPARPEPKICQHYMPKAKRNCTSAVSGKSKTGKYCGQHLKYEDKTNDEKMEKTEKKQCEYSSKNGTRCDKKISDKDEEGKHCSGHIKKSKSSEKSSPVKSKKSRKSEKDSSRKNSEVVLRPRKHSSLDIYIDATTNLVIDNDSKKIYGRLEADQILPLRKEDEEWLQKHHYEYDMEMWNIKHKSTTENDESGKSDDSEDEKEDAE